MKTFARVLVSVLCLVALGGPAQAADVPEKTWVFMPAPGRTVAGGGTGAQPEAAFENTDRHGTLAWNADNRRVYFQGGDYYGSSYRQETWSLDVRARLGSTNPATGWTLEYPYCGPATQVRPKGTDFVGWTWDSSRHVFWMVPGVTEAHSGSAGLCPGETMASASDRNLISQHIMSFDPVTKLWVDYGAWPPQAGLAVATSQSTWAAVYDPKTDTIVYAEQPGSNIGVYDIKRKTSTRYSYGNASGASPEIATHQWAADLAGRRIFIVDTRSQLLYQWDMDGHRFVGAPARLGAAGQPVAGASPCPTTLSATAQIDDGYLTWDSNAKVMIHVCSNYSGAWAYHPDQTPSRWEDLSALPVQGASSLPQFNTVTFDPVNNWLVGFGWDGIWLFRYGATATQSAALSPRLLVSPPSPLPPLPPLPAPALAPTVQSISRNTVVAGSAAFDLAATGAGFASGLKATVGGQPRTVTVASATQVTIGVLAADVAATGNVAVQVINPGACAALGTTGGVCASNIVQMAVTSPTPVAPPQPPAPPAPPGYPNIQIQISPPACVDVNVNGVLLPGSCPVPLVPTT